MANYTWGDTGEPLMTIDFICEDPAWMSSLPAGSTIVSNKGHVSSYWSQAGKVEVRLSDGTLKRYFIKLTGTPIGKIMSQGEYESMKALYAIVPDMVPKPHGWGTYEHEPNLHYFMCDYLDMQSEETPPMGEFCERIADMHKKSQGMVSALPGKYGFHVNTPNGVVSQPHIWNESWEGFIESKLRCALEQEIAVHGTSDEYEALWAPIFDKVVPRLLRPLETGGNSIVPTLVHGDLWYASTAVRADRDGMVIFDAAAVWAHNEYDLKAWGGEMHIFNHDWSDEYFKHYPRSEPAEDADDRIMLYALTSTLHNSILFKADRWREHVVRAVKDLTAKFPDGYTGSHRRKGEMTWEAREAKTQ